MKRFRFYLLFSAFCFLFSLSSFSQNIKIDSFEKLLPAAKEDTTKVNILNEISWNLMLVGNYDKAMQYANESKSLAEKLLAQNSSSLPVIKKILSKTHNTIGSIYSRQGNYPEALKNYLASLKIKEELGDKNGIARSYNNIGLIYQQQENYGKAVENFFIALDKLKEVNDTFAIGSVYNNIGITYEKQENYAEALKNYFASLKIKEEIGDKQGVAYAYMNIGECNVPHL